MSITTFEPTGTIVPTTSTALAVIESGEVLPRSFAKLLAAEACSCWLSAKKTVSGLSRRSSFGAASGGGGAISEGGPSARTRSRTGQGEGINRDKKRVGTLLSSFFSSIGYMSHVTGDETWRSRFSHSSPKLWADLASSSRANRPGCTSHRRRQG